MQPMNVYVISSWDDTTRLDLRVCELLEAYAMRATFFAVSNLVGRKITKEELRHISDRHEVGAHTLNHVDLTHVEHSIARREISMSKGSLEEILEKPVISFAYPYGHYNKTHVMMVRDAEYLCARTTKPFYTKPAENLYETNVSVLAYPHAFRDVRGLSRLFNLLPNIVFHPRMIKNWTELGQHVFDRTSESGGVFHLLGHAWQVDSMKGWQRLEDLLAHVAFRRNVTYLTIGEYARIMSDEKKHALT